MKVQYKNITNAKTKTNAQVMKTVPLSKNPHSPLKFNIHEEPLKSNSKNLAFKGFLYEPVLEAGKKATRQVRKFDVEDILGFTDKYLDSSVRGLYEDLKNHKIADKLISFPSEGQKEISFNKKTITHLILEGGKYPFTDLWCDLLNSAVGALRKIKPIENWAKSIYETPFLKNMRQKSKLDAKVNALRGTFEFTQDMKAKLASNELTEEQVISKFFQRKGKMNDIKTGSYDTKDERSLNRLVSGIPPAIFLSTDAYNLSRMCDDDSEEAKKESKIRFKQEASRVGINAYISYITMGALQTYINNSKAAVMAIVGGTALATEMFSRLANGKHITRLTANKAKEINSKNEKDKPVETIHREIEENYKSVFFRSANNKKAFASFSGSGTMPFRGFSKPVEKPQDNRKITEKPLLSISTILRASAGVIAAGLAVRGLKSIKINGKKPIGEFTESVQQYFNKLYKQITTDYNNKIDRKKFDKIVQTMEEQGFGTSANQYKNVADKYSEALASKEIQAILKNNADDLIQKLTSGAKTEDILKELEAKNLPEVMNKAKEIVRHHQEVLHLAPKSRKITPLVNFVMAPFKFTWGAITLPYKLFEKIFGLAPKKAKSPTTDIQILSDGIYNLNKRVFAKKFDADAFKTYISDNNGKAFNVDSLSSVSNSDLANLSKTAATAATIWFLMTDNYNMVMLKSNGSDKQGAELKFKERFVQEASRFFYQTLLIDLFNSTFRAQYHASLLGMSVISATNTTIGEFLTRMSVGVPTSRHTRDEIIQLEKEKEAKTGFIKGYYNFMSRLTGKKSLSEMQKVKTEKK